MYFSVKIRYLLNSEVIFYGFPSRGSCLRSRLMRWKNYNSIDNQFTIHNRLNKGIYFAFLSSPPHPTLRATFSGAKRNTRRVYGGCKATKKAVNNQFDLCQAGDILPDIDLTDQIHPGFMTSTLKSAVQKSIDNVQR